MTGAADQATSVTNLTQPSFPAKPGATRDGMSGSGLARVARWNGQTVGEHIFSVAQHSLLVEAFSGELQPELPAASRLTVLLHDAAEYVLGDVISPF